MSSTSLGDRHTPTSAPNRRLPPLTSESFVIATVNTVGMLFTFAWVVRILMFAACVTVGVWAYSHPENAVQAISTIDLETQEAQFDDQSVVFVRVFEAQFVVFVRVLATLIVIAACGIPSRYDRTSRLLSLAGYLLALGLFTDVSIRDNGQVLEQWFVIVYALFACGVPALVCGFEARRPDMIF